MKKTAVQRIFQKSLPSLVFETSEESFDCASEKQLFV